MNKYLVVISRYNDARQEAFDKYISPKNLKYCGQHNTEYIEVRNNYQFKEERDNPIWQKFLYVKSMLDEGRLKDGDKITVLDADMVFAKFDFEYITEKSFSYAIDNGNTHCLGNYTISINEWSRRMIGLILCPERYACNKNREIWTRWAEQASWYSLCGIKDHSWVPFFELPNNGWHSNESINPVFSIEELNENVEIRGPEWNTTLLEEEANDSVSKSLMQYNIVKSKKEDTIIRHFGGGQPWGAEYLLK
mgnify:FL=1|jgi:hypothetical protein|tara:strand:+ start:352 stop:1101 length:750 start_codon:yes stop_codon:yes gene_type:complete